MSKLQRSNRAFRNRKQSPEHAHPSCNQWVCPDPHADTKCASGLPTVFWRCSDRVKRGGIAVYELILVLPLLILPLLAVVVYGVLMANRQPLEMAARDGALIASHLDLPTTAGNVVPVEVENVIASALQEIGIDVTTALTDGTLTIRLEHNVDSATGGILDPPVVLEEGTLICPAPNLAPPSVTATDRGYVRLTVCVRSDLLTPNLMQTYYIDMSQRVTAQTKTLRHTGF